jgi:hypothetical protein
MLTADNVILGEASPVPTVTISATSKLTLSLGFSKTFL